MTDFRNSIASTSLIAVGLALLLLISWQHTPTASANPLTPVESIQTGAAHTCALTTAGGVKCWGDNSTGMLGNGTTTDSAIPVDVLGLATGVDQIAVGEIHACALKSDATVVCWGANNLGQLGDGTTSSSPSPVPVSGLSPGVTSVWSGGHNTCAVTSAGVECWGAMTGSSPEVIAGTASVVEVAPHVDHVCGRTATGSVLCWGDNADGQLGNGTTAASASPVAVSGISDAVALVHSGTGAFGFSCAVLASGDIQCWGRNNVGQLGTLTAETCGVTPCSTVPVTVSGLPPGVVSSSLGLFGACAASASTVTCWGDTHGSTPTDIPGFSGSMTQIARGPDYGCVRRSDATAECWGANGRGQLGDGTTISRNVPAAVVELGAKPTPTSTPCSGVCPTATPTPPCATSACMAIAVSDGAGGYLCRSDGQAKCKIGAGNQFTVIVLATKPPANGYILAEAFLEFGSSLIYTPAPDAGLETIWPDAALNVRDIFPTAVHHGSITGLIPPLPVSSYEGPLYTMNFECSPGASTSVLELLLKGDPVAGTIGSHYKDPSNTPYLPEVAPLAIACVEALAESQAVGGVALDGGLAAAPGAGGSDGWAWWLATGLVGTALVGAGALAWRRRPATTSR